MEWSFTNNRVVNNYETSFYYDAYCGELTKIWGNTQFMNEIENLSYHKALSTMTRDNNIGESNRRRLLYYYLKPYFRSNHAEDSLNNLYSILPTSNLYVKRALNNLCVVYDEEPQITITGANEEKATEFIDESNLINLLQRSYRSLKLHNQVLIRPYFTRRNNKSIFKFKYWTPDKFRIKYSVLGDIEEIWIHKINVKDNVIQDEFYVWDKESLRVVSSEGKLVPFNISQNGKPIQVNEYKHGFGEIPFQLRELNEIDDYELESDGGGLWELLKAQIDFNAYEVISKEQTIYNGFPLRFLGNWNLAKDEILSPNSVIVRDQIMANDNEPIPPFTDEIGADSTFQIIEELKTTKIREALRQFGLPASVIDETAQVSSGVALKEMRRELDEARLEDLNILSQLDKELIQLTLKVANLDPASGNRGRFNDTYEIDIEYQDPQNFSEWEQLQLEADYLRTNGLISPSGYVKKMTYKEVTSEEEAIKFILDNKELFKQIGVEDESGTQSNGGDEPELNISPSNVTADGITETNQGINDGNPSPENGNITDETIDRS